MRIQLVKGYQSIEKEEVINAVGTRHSRPSWVLFLDTFRDEQTQICQSKMTYIRKELSVILSIQVLYTKQNQTGTKPEKRRGE